MSTDPVTWSGELRSIAHDIRQHGGQPQRDAEKLHKAADEIDRKTDALIDLLKLFMEIDAGDHARHPACVAARAALGNRADGQSAGQAGLAATSAASRDFKSTDGRRSQGGSGDGEKTTPRG